MVSLLVSVSLFLYIFFYRKCDWVQKWDRLTFMAPEPERLLVLELCFCCLVVSTWFLAHLIRECDSLQIWQRCLKGQGYDLHFVPLLKLKQTFGCFSNERRKLGRKFCFGLCIVHDVTISSNNILCYGREWDCLNFLKFSS